MKNKTFGQQEGRSCTNHPLDEKHVATTNDGWLVIRLLNIVVIVMF